MLPCRLARPLIGRFLLQAAPCALQGMVRANALFHHRAAPKAEHYSSGMGGALPSASEHRADAARAARPPTLPPCTSSPRFVDLGEDVICGSWRGRRSPARCGPRLCSWIARLWEAGRLGLARAWGGEGLGGEGWKSGIISNETTIGAAYM